MLLSRIEGQTLFTLYKDNTELQRLVKEELASEKYDDVLDVDFRPVDHPLREKVAQILSHVEPLD